LDRLGVEGVPVPVRTRFEPFREDVRAGRIALLRAGFGTVSAGTPDDPMVKPAEFDVADLTTLCSCAASPGTR
jgi:hypothetical protein